MMAVSSSRLRIAVVQFAPKLGEVHANIAKARELCRGLAPRSVDLVCFPEMIFSGYMFPDAPSIAPYLEHPDTGPTSTFCAELARHLQCYVTAGFPERLESSDMQSPTPSDPSSLSPMPIPTPTTNTTTTPSPSPLLGANSALLYDATGHLLHTYHKSNLFPTDITWARPGPGFTTLDLPMPFGRTAVAICNDLNVNVGGPDGGVWRSIERGPYELAGYCRREGVRMLVLLNAWLRSEEEEEEEKERKKVKVRAGGGEAGTRGGDDRDRIDGRLEDGKDADSEEMEDDRGGLGDDDDGSEPNWRVLNYWAMRLRPLWAKDIDASMDTEMARTNDDEEFLVVICNRFGHERGKTFAGSSAMFSMRPGSGKPRLLHVMGEREEGVSVWTARIGSHTLA